MTVPAVVGVCGGGRMGAGIAHAFAVAGSAVTVVENDDRAAAAARTRVEKSLAKSVELGATVTGTVEVATGPEALATASLVIEAVPEVPEVKQAVLR